MLRPLAGYQTQYNGIALYVVSEFNEWRVLGIAPGVTIHGQRQFAEDKAKAHAVAIAREYVAQFKGGEMSEIPELEWKPTGPETWLVHHS